MKPLISIDGSMGEGGGQVLRTSRYACDECSRARETVEKARRSEDLPRLVVRLRLESGCAGDAEGCGLTGSSGTRAREGPTAPEPAVPATCDAPGRPTEDEPDS